MCLPSYGRTHRFAPTMKTRLQKILSQAGIASRRRAEELIFLGRVRVNGAVVKKLGSQADPEKDAITVDGRPIKIISDKVTYLFHKPKNVMVTRRDPEGRPTIYDYLKNIPERVNPVGRLDFDSEGLLLLTNDGDLHAYLTHPRHEVPKVYQVKISGRLSAGQKERMERGIDIGGYTTQAADIKIVKENPHNCWIEVVIHEGKNRQVRRMVEALGLKVLRLVRVSIGPLRLGDLKKGEWRCLKPSELEVLRSGTRT